ncbi:hypothetical protein [Herbidospora cretacea]|uniref:hypothetical protein n=1 Tax=Herbidospora cretacea TaxID=28444 RepID=UPI0007730BE4|nr:hypothetical protein [Herbidospora cretacea]
MSARLEIADGSPTWYLSDSIWVVPGADPNGPLGLPVVGEKNYLWAKVTNTGDSGTDDVVVYFWWAVPATVMRYGNLKPVGMSKVALEPGESREVLCVSPWRPEYLNSGHLCLLALAYSPSDDDTWFPEGHLHVRYDHRLAQRNIQLLKPKRGHMVYIRILVSNPHDDRDIVTAVRLRRIALEDVFTQQLGKAWPSHDLDGVAAGLATGEVLADDLPDVVCTGEWDGIPPGDLPEVRRVTLAPGQRYMAVAVFAMPEYARPGQGAGFLIEQWGDEQEEMGGCAIVVVPESE